MDLPQPKPEKPKIPPWAEKSIAEHKSGKGKKLMWVEPGLANDLHKFYGPAGHVVMHDETMHGPIGHRPPEPVEPTSEPGEMSEEGGLS